MAHINLLPWREELRKQRETEFYILLGVAAVVGILLFFAWMQYTNSLIDHQRARNSLLNNEIAILNAKIKEIEALEVRRNRLLQRKEIIERLQADRTQMVHLFDEMVRTIPEGVQLVSIKQDGKVLTLKGVAQSNARVSSYMRNLSGSNWLHNPDLDIVEASEEDRNYKYEFTLRVGIGRKDDLNADSEESQDGFEQ